MLVAAPIEPLAVWAIGGGLGGGRRNRPRGSLGHRFVGHVLVGLLAAGHQREAVTVRVLEDRPPAERLLDGWLGELDPRAVSSAWVCVRSSV
jgi:hypothetical protein